VRSYLFVRVVEGTIEEVDGYRWIYPDAATPHHLSVLLRKTEKGERGENQSSRMFQAPVQSHRKSKFFRERLMHMHNEYMCTGYWCIHIAHPHDKRRPLRSLYFQILPSGPFGGMLFDRFNIKAGDQSSFASYVT
jgi:hypothetical protein